MVKLHYVNWLKARRAPVNWPISNAQIPANLNNFRQKKNKGNKQRWLKGQELE